MMRNRQGVTALGWLILLTHSPSWSTPASVAPVYLNYMKVVKTLEGTKSELKGGGATASTIKAAIDKHFEIDMVDYPDTKDIKITRDDGAWLVEANTRIRRRCSPTSPCTSLSTSRSHRRRIRRCRRRAALAPAAHERADWPARWMRERLGYEPRELALFRAALTHRSAAGANNERLEFLGDAVLNLLVARALYLSFPAATRGT